MHSKIYFQILLTISIFNPYFNIFSKELHWNWNNINVNNLWFPQHFYWGCSTSATQIEGNIKNSWTEFENYLVKDGLLAPDQRAGKACDHWTRFKEDIALIKQCGMNMYRFSIEWSRIEPEEGRFDIEAMKHYIYLIDELLANEITPMLVLFHHTYPIWFAKKGAFEKKENMRYFSRFALHVFKYLHTKVPFWIIFNEPVGYAIEGYYRGVYPPGKKSLQLAGKVARNLLNGHVQIYQEFKKINSSVKVGIAHIFNPLDTYSDWNPLEAVAAKTFDYLVNDITVDFFKDGNFNWLYMVRKTNKKAPESIDFIGINYYTHTIIHQESPFSIIPSHRPEEKITGSGGSGRADKVLYAEGLYRSIKKVSVLKKPIFITENGCSAQDPQLRKEYIQKHLYVISKAIQEGYKIYGYLFWTLLDCFCWRKGYQDKHGIYEVDFTTQERTFRPSAQPLIDIIKKFRKL